MESKTLPPIRIIQKTAAAIRKARPSQDTRLPISVTQLQLICQAVKLMYISKFLRDMFIAAFLLSFYAFLLPGEVAKSHNSLKFKDVTIQQDTVSLKFRRFKHSKGRSHVINIFSPKSQVLCPIKALSKYVHRRGYNKGKLFVYQDGSPITYSHMKRVFQQATRKAGICGKFSLHSFRIGAATHAAATGFSEPAIRSMGRWHSSSARLYVRIPDIKF